MEIRAVLHSVHDFSKRNGTRGSTKTVRNFTEKKYFLITEVVVTTSIVHP